MFRLQTISRLLSSQPPDPRIFNMSAQTLFFKSSQFAVVGASKDQTKFGTKILKWYQNRDLTVTPVHPKEDELEGVKTVKNLAGLKSPTATSVSIVTPPKVTLAVLKEGKELGVPAFWIQPGAEDDAVRAFVTKEGLTEKVVIGGPCVLVNGDGIRQSLL
ncbi:CoA binding domain [Rhizoctonia solani]|uniref:CoA binding domain n=2 Tax=Rhizoctonia solani TaxID=456999 RepID=A0A8H7I6B8_9AGAM|nr:CoA binding domain [Rhizoctonia solani]KAF8750828.1 CoA binding domain [Rhizoctonia solani]